MLVLVGAFAAAPALAVETIHFGSAANQRVQLNIDRYLTENKEIAIPSPVVAPLDLNEDGIVEFIVRDANCAQISRECLYVVLADTDSALMPLGQITARNLALGKGYTNGVRDLMALDSPANDFEYRRYVWEPLQSRYTIAGGGS